MLFDCFLNFPEYRHQADRLVVTQVLLSTLFKYGVICPPPVFAHVTCSLRILKNKKWTEDGCLASSNSYIRYFVGFPNTIIQNSKGITGSKSLAPLVYVIKYPLENILTHCRTSKDLSVDMKPLTLM